MPRPKGSGSGTTVYRRRSDSRWVAVCRKHGETTYFYGHSKSAVTASLNEHLAKHASDRALGIRREAGTVSVKDYLAAYLQRQLQGDHNVASTKKRKVELLNRVFKAKTLDGVLMADLTAGVLERLYGEIRDTQPSRLIKAPGGTFVERRLSPKTIANLNAVLRHAFNLAQRDGMLMRDPTKRIELPIVEGYVPRFMDWAEANVFLRYARECSYLHRLFAVALMTGMRQGELLALTWDDWEADGKVSITASYGLTSYKKRAQLHEAEAMRGPKAPKTKRSIRRLPLPNAAISQLNNQREEQVAAGLRFAAGGRVFTNRTGGQLTTSVVAYELDKVMQTASHPYKGEEDQEPVLAYRPKLRFHDLRHSFASIQLSLGANPSVIAAYLGHSSPALVYRTYGHVIESQKSHVAVLTDKVFPDYTNTQSHLGTLAPPVGTAEAAALIDQVFAEDQEVPF